MDDVLVETREPKSLGARSVIDDEAAAVELHLPLVFHDQTAGEVVPLLGRFDRRPRLTHQVFELVRRQHPDPPPRSARRLERVVLEYQSLSSLSEEDVRNGAD